MQDYETSDMLGLAAVVGMAVRVPGANNLQEFWANLCNGVDSISHFTNEELLDAGIPQQLLDNPNYVKANGILPDIEMFDAEFFGINKREAQITDPQHRNFLECAWEALESAGCDPYNYKGRIGVFASESLNSYFIQNLQTNREMLAAVGDIQTILGNDRDFLATRLSFILNLRGPSIVLQSACSSSLSAVHLACQSLTNGESDMVIAGGVSISLPQRAGYFYHVGGIHSLDGRCRTFDENATGTVGGNGVGLVVLKRLEDAVRDGDYIYSVIRGSAINNDGNAKVGYTAPSVEGQAEVIEEALAVARVDASSITYVEAHGTGTPLGDPIEVEALNQAFSISQPEKQSCAIGSIKSNLGHLDAAAGVVGLIKTSLMLKNRQLVPSLHFEKPNPKINFSESPFYVNVAHRDWQSPGVRRAGVSSFGIGGTNVHIVLEEFNDDKNHEAETPEKLLVFSARNKNALKDLQKKTASFFEANENIDLNDAAYTLQTGRRHFEVRSAVVCRDKTEAAEKLKELSEKSETENTVSADGSPSELAFLFPGQGTQYPSMAKEIYQSESLFRKLFDQCAESFQNYIGSDLRQILYDDETAQAGETINQTAITQPLLFTVEYALTGLLKSWGIEPSAMIGHSLGEYTAACVAGVFTFEDAVKIVAVRAQLMQKLPAGSMLSVKTAPEKIKEFIGAKLSVAVLNAPDSCVVSGNNEDVEKLRLLLEEKKISCRLLKTSHAFHSPMMNDILEPFYRQMSEVKLSPPQIPFISNLTGTWIKDSEATSAEYWVKHLRNTVRFSDGIKCLANENRFIFVEAGPKSLSILAQMQTSAKTVTALPAAGEETSSLRTVTELVGNLWTSGYKIDWENFNGSPSQRRRIPLPTYAFQREYFWVNSSGKKENSEKQNPEKQNLVKENPVKENPVKENPVSSPVERKEKRTEADRQETVWKNIREIIFDLTGSPVSEIDAESTFYQLGVDSLLLIQASQEITKRLGIEISFQQILGEYPTLNSLVLFLSENLPAAADEDLFDEPESVTSPMSDDRIRTAETIISDAITQLRQSLAELKNGVNENADFKTAPESSGKTENFSGGKNTQPESPQFVPFKPIKIENNSDLTEAQEKHLSGLTKKYNRKTAASKQLIQESRAKHADSRLSLNFRRIWKEMVYPIIGDKSQASKIWDVDGNKYLDLTMGFGVNLFGHSPDFIKTALSEQLEKGLHLGPQAKLAGEVSELFSELTGQERVAYTVSETEAVMIALRLARTVTGRDKIVCFSGSYHGFSDAVLVRQNSEAGKIQAVPPAPGITKDSVPDTIVLDYDDPESLNIISENAGSIAAVIVEAVQSRRPELQPKEFLEKLRTLTSQKGIVLIFDETITGFRLHPQGAQGWFGIKADLSTYGKIIGGGLPIGVIAGKADILSAIDGGMWNFGDDSYPEAKQTYVAGTFYKHPLGMAAMRAVLRHLLDEGAALQGNLNLMTTSMVNRLNLFFKNENLAINVVHCASLFRFNIPRSVILGDLFFFHLIEKGIYIWEGRNCFLSTAHTVEDLNFLYDSVVETVAELKNNGFFTEPVSGKRPNSETEYKNNNGSATFPVRAASGEKEPDDRFPVTEGQQQIWLASQLSETASSAYNESVSLNFKGKLNLRALTESVNRLVIRHEALRAVFSPQGDYQKILDERKIEVVFRDLSSAEEKKAAVEALLRKESQTPFDLIDGPLVRALIIKEDEENHFFCLTIHHLVVDGWSFSIVLKELKEIYLSIAGQKKLDLPPAASYGEFTKKQIDREKDSSMSEAENFWLAEFADSVPVADLPADFQRPESMTFNDGDVKIELDKEFLNALKAINDKTASTTFVSFLTIFNLALSYISKKSDFIVGIHTAGQLNAGAGGLVGYYVNLLPLRTKINTGSDFAGYLKEVKSKLFEIYKYQSYPLGKLIKKLNPQRLRGRSPLIAVTFNSFRAHKRETFGDLIMETHENPSGYSRFDLSFKVLEWDDKIECQFTYNKDIFAAETVTLWLNIMSKILMTAGKNPGIKISDVTAVLAGYEESLNISKQKEFKEKRLASLKRFTRKNN